MADRTIAEQLLDAQVAFVLAQVTGEQLSTEVEAMVEDALTALTGVRIDELVRLTDVQRLARRIVADLPVTAAATTLVDAAAVSLHEGPQQRFALGELIARDHVETLVEEMLALGPLAQRGLDELAESPLVAAVASRFVGRIVSDVLAANRSMAEKIPGMGSLMSMGAGAASRMLGAADKQLEQLLGDTAGKGAAFAMRRLNKIVADTLQDPLTRHAALEVWDHYSDRPLPAPRDFLTLDDTQRVAALLHEIVASGSPTPPIGALVDATVAVFFSQYGQYDVPTLLADLEISSRELTADLASFVAAVVDALPSPALELAIRARLEPFYTGPAVAEILGRASDH